MDSRQLEQFRIIARTENLQQASEQLYVSPQALSKTIRSLEDELSVKLFDRVGKSLKINRYGEKLLYYADLIHDDLAAAREAIRELTTEGIIRIQSISYAFLCYLPEMFLDYRQYSLSVVNSVGSQLPVNDLLNGKCHILIDYDRPEYDKYLPALRKLSWCWEFHILNVTEDSRLYHKETLTAEDLQGETLIISQQEKAWLDDFRAYYGLSFDTIEFDYVAYRKAVRLYRSTLFVNLKQPIDGQPPAFPAFYGSREFPNRNLPLILDRKRTLCIYCLKERYPQLRDAITQIRDSLHPENT